MGREEEQHLEMLYKKRKRKEEQSTGVLHWALRLDGLEVVGGGELSTE